MWLFILSKILLYLMDVKTLWINGIVKFSVFGLQIYYIFYITVGHFGVLWGMVLKYYIRSVYDGT